MLGSWNVLQGTKKYLRLASIIGLVFLLTLSGVQKTSAATELSCDIEQNGVPVNTLDIPVGSTFTVNVWIRNIPGNGLDGFYFAVKWDPNMMILDSYQQTPNSNNWDVWSVGTGADYIEFDALTFGGGYITDDMCYLNLTFRCLNQGSSPMNLTNVHLHINGQETVTPPDFIVTVNQLSPVGGELLTANNLTVLAPYLTLIGLFVVVSSIVYALRRRSKT